MNKKRIAFLILGFILKTMTAAGICFSLYWAVYTNYIIICYLLPTASFSELLTGDYMRRIAAVIVANIGVTVFTLLEILICRRCRFMGSIITGLISFASLFYYVMLGYTCVIFIREGYEPSIADYIGFYLMNVGKTIALGAALTQIVLTGLNFNAFKERAEKLGII
ncbi:MAG: hypothetical protein LIO87_07665 [Eubacterium sp.]|nr:hypothetical protein [Eubacterium sp.]